MDQHKIQQKNSCEQYNKSIGGDISSGGVLFAISVKGGEKEKEHDDRGSMSVAINEKGGYCWMRLSLMSKFKKREANHLNLKKNSCKSPYMTDCKSTLTKCKFEKDTKIYISIKVLVGPKVT